MNELERVIDSVTSNPWEKLKFGPTDKTLHDMQNNIRQELSGQPVYDPNSHLYEFESYKVDIPHFRLSVVFGGPAKRQWYKK
jgi:hypothetical protein